MGDKLWNSNYVKIWLGNFCLHFSFTLIVPLLPLYLSETFGASKDMIGFVLAGYAVMALLVRPFSGYVVDSFPRKTVLIICYSIMSAMFVGYLCAGSLVVFAIFRTVHGAPFGATTVATATVAIDSLPSSRRSEGIGYFGLSNNLAMAIGPVLAVYLLNAFGNNFNMLFALSLIVSLFGLVLDATIELPKRDFVPDKKVISLDRFFLVKGSVEAVNMLFLATSWGILSTYVAIYGKEQLGITEGTGVFFSLLAIGLIISRLTGAHALRENRITRNAIIGLLFSLCGYILFASVHTLVGYYGTALLIGLGNGHMFPAFQTMFINLAENSQRGTANSSMLSAWDAGMGLGVLVGGVLSEHLGYNNAFIGAMIINFIGVLVFFLKTRIHFERNKLR